MFANIPNICYPSFLTFLRPLRTYDVSFCGQDSRTHVKIVSEPSFKKVSRYISFSLSLFQTPLRPFQPILGSSQPPLGMPKALRRRGRGNVRTMYIRMDGPRQILSLVPVLKAKIVYVG